MSLAGLVFEEFWKETGRIALDVARGIIYLHHEECEVHIIHCNIRVRLVCVFK